MATTHEPTAAPAIFRFVNSFARELQGFYVPQRPAIVFEPRLLFLNDSLAEELDLDLTSFNATARAAIFAGNTLPEGAEPLAQAYAGHKFGGFSPQLGDGRALVLGEVIDRQGRRRDIAFKGCGRTPFARGGDGKAAVGPMLREVLIGESMHALGIPTTRALAVAATGEQVYRQRVLPGAVLTRVAASHIRVGTFEFCASHGGVERVRKLAEYTIARHDPALVTTPQPFLALLQNVAERQAALVAQWMNVSFIHGVMNTDNMTISGDTIDYGPCAFMEAYDPATVFSSIDHQGRYAFGNQPDIACWNLARLAETLLPLLSDDPRRSIAMAREVIAAFPAQFRKNLRTAHQARAASSRTGRRQPRCCAGRRLVEFASCRAGRFHPRVAAARGRRRRRGATACAVRRCARARCMAGPLESPLRHGKRQRTARLSNGRSRACQGDAQRQSKRDPPQPSRGRGTGCCVRRR